MITVKQFLGAGFQLAAGDVVDKYKIIDPTGLIFDGGAQIKALAWRANTGSQPVPDDCPVIYMTCTGIEYSSKAGGLNWNLRLPIATIIKWKPDLEALEKMLSERQDCAINELRKIAKQYNVNENDLIDSCNSRLAKIGLAPIIDDSLLPQTDREKMLVMALLRKCRGLPVEDNDGNGWALSNTVYVDIYSEHRIPPSKLDLLSEQVEQALGKEAAKIVKEAVDKCPMMKEVFGE